MPRSKNRVLDIEDDGEYMTIQWQRKDGQVVSGDFKLIGWCKAPAEIDAETRAIINSPPVAIAYPASRGAKKPKVRT